MTEILFILGIITIGIGVLFAFFTGHLVGFLLTVLGAVTGGMILIALGQILDNQAMHNVRIRDLDQKYEQIWLKDQPKYRCTECDHTYVGQHERCPNCYVALNTKN